jgi:hypothetical protein
MVASIMMCSKSGSSAKALKRLSHRPLRAQRRKRVYTLFHVPNFIGQVAPRRSRLQHPQHGIHEQAIVFACATLVAFLAGNQSLDTLPLPVGELASNQDRLLQFAILNHNREPTGIL